jgi:uncharacterized protein
MSEAFCVWTLILLGGVMPLEEMRFESVFEQRYDYSCGIASVSSLVSLYWGYAATEDELLSKLASADDRATYEDITMHDMQIILEQLGFAAGGFMLTYEELLQAAAVYGPLIVHMAEGEGHFALFLGETGGFAVIADPSLGCHASTIDEFVRSWSNMALAAYHPGGVLDVGAASRAISVTADRIEMLRLWALR